MLLLCLRVLRTPLSRQQHGSGNENEEWTGYWDTSAAKNMLVAHALSSEWMLARERSRARMMHCSPLCLWTHGAALSPPPCPQVQQDEGRTACAWPPAGPPSASDHWLRWVLPTLWAATSPTAHLNSTTGVNNNSKKLTVYLFTC